MTTSMNKHNMNEMIKIMMLSLRASSHYQLTFD
jgi:hypothetical protein